jgi:hypothetical protein
MAIQLLIEWFTDYATVMLEHRKGIPVAATWLGLAGKGRAKLVLSVFLMLLGFHLYLLVRLFAPISGLFYLAMRDK